MLAGHAVKPVCPRCNHQVRSGVELQAALVDLQVLAVQLEPLRWSENREDQELLEDVRVALVLETSEMRAELNGAHERCPPASGAGEAVIEEARERAAICARDRVSRLCH